MSRFAKEAAAAILQDADTGLWIDTGAPNAPKNIVIGKEQTGNGNGYGSVLNDAFNKARKEGKPMDAATLMTTGGGALLAYALASSLVDKPDSEKRNDSMWMKVLRSLIPVGAGVAGGVAGHYLGTKMAEDGNSTTNSTAKASSKQDANVDTPVRVERDWIGDYIKANDKMQLGYLVPATAAGFGAVNRGMHFRRRFSDWYTGGENPRLDRNGNIIPDSDYINKLRSKVQEARQMDASFRTADSDWSAQKGKIDRENIEGKAKRDAEAAAVGKQNAIEQAQYKNMKQEFDRQYQAWERGGRKGKPPVPPKPPKIKVVPDFVPKGVPPRPTPTGATVAAEKALLKRNLGWRAVANGVLSTGFAGLSTLFTMLGLSNREKAGDLLNELRRRVGDDENLKALIKERFGINL